MYSMEIAIEMQEAYVRAMLINRDCKAQLRDRAAFLNANSLLKGAQDTLMCMYDDLNSRGAIVS